MSEISRFSWYPPISTNFLGILFGVAVTRIKLCGNQWLFSRNIMIASPKGEANNRIRRKKAMSLCLSVCVYVTLHSSGVSRQISDFLVLKITQKICGATRTKIISFA
jgi:hypothetical protein